MTGPRERPILFSGPMVRAILEGRKTETRRVVKPQPDSASTQVCYDGGDKRWFSWVDHEERIADGHSWRCPYGEPGVQDWRSGIVPDAGWYHVEGWDDGPVWLIPVLPEAAGEEPGINWGWHPGDDPEAIEMVPGMSLSTIRWKRAGDRLWVRETHALNPRHPRVRVAYQADMMSWGLNNGWAAPGRDGIGGLVFPSRIGVGAPIPKRWRPSIHMPRWASRILLEVTGVRVERVQEISEEGYFAEGLRMPPIERTVDGGGGEMVCANGWWRPEFSKLWDRINGKRHPWESNPWVWVVSFRVLRPAGKEAAA